MFEFYASHLAPSFFSHFSNQRKQCKLNANKNDYQLNYHYSSFST
ncbi:hypothetical protein PPBDW_II0024 [Photobacterium kishitanii]|nr:hypothetical protein PPBDW_II0024 [Photobacterium kishitanii]